MGGERDEVASGAVTALRSEIERTRGRIAATVDAIEARLRPRRIVAEAGETIKEAAARPLETARSHPGLTIAVAGVILAIAADLVRRRVQAVARSRTPGAIALVVMCATLAAASQALGAQRAPVPAPPPSVTAIGCLAQVPDSVTAPPTGHEQAAAKGLTLTRATLKEVAAAAPRSAVPGSRPSGSGTGTTDAAVAPAASRVEQSFWIVGPRASELLRFVGRRVEVTGPFDDRLAANPGQQTADAGAAAARRAPTAPPDPSNTAHPSAPTRAVSVSSFRVLDETCS